jgi:ribose-phosphate pyrophosphokinase
MSALRASATAVGVVGVPSGGVRTGRRATSRFGAGLARGERAAAVAPRLAASTRAARDDAGARSRVSRRADAPLAGAAGRRAGASAVRSRAIVDRSSAAEDASAAEAAAAAINLDDVAVAGAAMASVTETPAPAREVVTPVSVIAAEAGLDVGSSSAAAENAGAAAGPPRKSLLRKQKSIGLLGSDRDVRSTALPRLQRLDKDSKYPVLFYAPEMEDLAKKIAAEDVGGSSVELGDIDWRKFPDGFPDLFVNDAYGVRDRHVAFLASFHSPEVIFEQISIIYSLPKMFVASFTLILPFFPTGTSERVEREGEIATAVTLARILSNIPPSRGGPCSTLIFDIHALQERFYFGDNILPCFESGIPLLLNRLAECPDADNIVIAYPDEGAWKRFHGFFKGMEEVVCTKVRDGSKRQVKLKEGEPAGRHVVVVDDLVQSGGTLIECQKLLSRLGAVKVSAYVTHGVFPGESWKRFTVSSGGAGGQGFTKFFLTDSCPQTAEAVEGIEPFEILSLSRPIAEALHV